jgi:hypothetical protein
MDVIPADPKDPLTPHKMPKIHDKKFLEAGVSAVVRVSMPS